MKAITLYQPYASLRACNAKKYETRSWATNYRGPIAIHAGLKKSDDVTKNLSGAAIYTMVQAVRHITEKLSHTSMYLPLDLLPRGAVIAIDELVECHLIVQHIKKPDGSYKIACVKSPEDTKVYAIHISAEEFLFGDWTPGRYAWELANVKMLPEPIPAKGHQRLWNWEVRR